MFILSRVCAEFHDRHGNVIHRISRNDLLTFREAPDAIQEDPLFQLLLADGSIETPPKDAKEKKKLENDPTAGADASGRRIVDAGGVSDDDSEVNRNKRAVRGTVAPIEVAEQKSQAEQPEDPTLPSLKQPVKAKAEEKPGRQKTAETKAEEAKPAEGEKK